MRKFPLEMTIAALAAAFVSIMGGAPLAAQEYSCRFGSGSAHVFENGGYEQRRAGTLEFGIAAVDVNAQTAELRTGKGSGRLRVVLALGAQHFIEVAAAGYLNLTTIYEQASTVGVYPAVHSRHSNVAGAPVVSQLHGFCRSAEQPVPGAAKNTSSPGKAGGTPK